MGLKRIIRHAIAFFGPLFIAIFFWTAYLFITAPVEELRGVVTYSPPFKDYTRQAGLGVPDNLTINDLPLSMILMTLISEDREFVYDHGVRPGKMLHIINEYLFDHGPLIGGSTITQQVAKNFFVGPERTFYRKYVELIYALKIERFFTKEEIFTIYINMAQVGPDAYGYGQAAQTYFHKKPMQLTLEEQAFIISNLPSPVRYSAWFRNHQFDSDAEERLDYLLREGLVLRATQVPFKLTQAQQGHLFSSYMRGNRNVCISSVTRDSIAQQAQMMAKHFAELYRSE